MASNNNTQTSKALVPVSSTPAPSRSISYRPFSCLMNLSLQSIGMGLNDVSFNCRRELVFLVGSIACPIELGEASGSQEQFLETPEENLGETEPCSFGLFPEAAPEPEAAPLPEVFVEDLNIGLPEETETSPLSEKESTPPGSHTGEKRKRVKMVARRSRTPRSRPQPRSLPTQTPSSPKSSKPSRKSARLVFKSTPRTSKPSAPVIEEISSSSTEGFSSSDSEATSFKQGAQVFSESCEEQAPPKPSTKPVSKPSLPKTLLKRKVELVSAATSSPSPSLPFC